VISRGAEILSCLSSDIPSLASFVCLTEVEMDDLSRLRGAAEFDGGST
jgi:hypothetical protein